LGRTYERSRELAEAFGLRPLPLEELAQAERVLLAVQPRDFPPLAPLLAHPGVGYISIMAGVSTAVLARRLDNRRVVRTMPNLAAVIGESSTALTALPRGPGGRGSGLRPGPLRHRGGRVRDPRAPL
jgi:pyrroline-5-carboxylate reductase